MKRCLFALLLAALLAPAVARASDYYAFEQITVAATAIGFTAATIQLGTTHPQARWASCRLEGAEVRYRFDGTKPTSSVGTLLEVGDTIVLTDPVAMIQFTAIRTGGTSGTLSCSYVG